MDSKPYKKQKPVATKQQNSPLKMYIVPCSCGRTFAVSKEYDRRGTAWSRYLTCPQCGKRHDPKNRLLEIGYQSEGFWNVEKC
jgi:hydrogenase maturation factor HypF (carbamoyltransferase family)